MTRWRSTPTLRARLLSTLHSCTRSRDTETSYRSILVIVFPILELMYFMYYLCNLLYIFLLTVKQQFVKSILYIDFTEFTAEQYYFMKHTCISVSVLSNLEFTVCSSSTLSHFNFLFFCTGLHT